MTRRGMCTLAAVAVTLASRAVAESPETEFRLKTAGVDPDLRVQIHKAISLGTRYLRAAQRSDGSFFPREGGVAQEPHPGGWTGLCGLALRHSGLPDAVKDSRRALAYLAPEGHPRQALLRTIYSASLTAMLDRASGREEAMARLSVAIAHGQQADGWWGYATRAGGVGDLSNSQFAVLGLHAARLAGLDVEAAVWTRHLRSLLKYQMPDGSWSYGGPIPWSYPTGTFMGLANLIIAGKHSAVTVADQPVYTRALGAMARDVPATLDGFRQGWLRDYYTLYAMERACIFLGAEKVANRMWYIEGARALVEAQRDDGSWSGSDYRYWSSTPPKADRGPKVKRSSLEATAFALLFLARAPESYRTTTPRSIDWTVTSGTPNPATPAVELPPPAQAPTAVPLDLALQMLEILEKQLASRAGRLEPSVAAVHDAYVRLAAAGPEAETWRRRAERATVRALEQHARASPKEAHAAMAGSRRAAASLGDMNPDVSPNLIRAVDRSILKAYDRRHEELLSITLMSLARLNRIESLKWMRDKLVGAKGTPECVAQTVAALEAMIAFRDVPGRERHRSFERILHLYVGLESPPRQGSAKGHPSQEPMALRSAVIRSLQHFARDTKTGLPPRRGPPTCGWIVTIRGFQAWFKDHASPNNRPWGKRSS